MASIRTLTGFLALTCCLAPAAWAAPPDNAWNLTSSSSSLAELTDCTGPSSQSNANQFPAGTGTCQNYDVDPTPAAGNDLYESLNPAGGGFRDSDIWKYRTGRDAEFFYFEVETVDTFDYDSTGNSRYYEFQVDRDLDGQPDFYFGYRPVPTTHYSSTWIANAESSPVEGFRDLDNNYGDDDGDGTLAMVPYDELRHSSYTHRGGSASNSDGYEADWKNTTFGTPANSYTYYRIVTRTSTLPGPDNQIGTGDDVPGSKRIIQLAVRNTFFCLTGSAPCTAPTDVSSCVALNQTSSIGPGKLPWHDESPASSLGSLGDNTSGQWFDTACGVGQFLTTPVTLAQFTSESSGGSVVFDWTTATESQNVGFHLEELDEATGTWRRINRRLIATKGVDSLSPRTYSYRAAGTTGRTFRIVDVSTDLAERRHGPFELGDTYGEAPIASELDWRRIRATHDKSARAQRSQRLREQLPRVDAVRKGRAARSGGSPMASVASATAGQSASSGPIADIWVDRTGIYRLTHADLLAAGFDLSGVPVSSIALTHRGASFPVRVFPDQGSFGPGGFVEFVGQAIQGSLYTRTNRYQLWLDSSKADRVAVDNAGVPGPEAPESYTHRSTTDDNHEYAFYSPTGDPWFDTRLLAFNGSPLVRTFDLQVDSLRQGPAVLRARLYGVTNWPSNPDHHVQVYLNDQLLADRIFDGLHDLALSVTLPPGLLREGSNTLAFRLPVDLLGINFDMVHLDTYGVDYPRGFVARDGALDFRGRAKSFTVSGLAGQEAVVYRLGPQGSRPELLEKLTRDGITLRFRGEPKAEAGYLVSAVGSLLKARIEPARVPSDIASGQARLLILAHQDFVGGLGDLVAAREAQGWTVKVVDVAEVYGAFSDGVFDAHAIADYIRYAAQELGTEMVLLVGADSYDYLDYLGKGSLSFVPTLYTNVGNSAAFTPSDSLLADVDGDRIPDLPIGRLPVYDQAELEAMIRKIMDYESRGYSHTAVIAADNDEPGAPFSQGAQQLLDGLPGDWSSERAAVGLDGLAAARSTLLGAINRGVAVTTFLGHSGPNTWTFDGLFGAADVPGLTNEGRPTVVVQWGCWNTYHVSPEIDTLAHQLMLRDGGAAAVIGAATLTTVSADLAIAPLMQKHLVASGSTLGGAMQAAKEELAQVQPGLAEILLGATLLGDPTMPLTP